MIIINILDFNNVFSKKLNNSAHIKHAFFSRRGGYSKGLYKGLNCGRGSGDLKKNISKNLEYVAKKNGCEKKKFNFNEPNTQQ